MSEKSLQIYVKPMNIHAFYKFFLRFYTSFIRLLYVFVTQKWCLFTQKIYPRPYLWKSMCFRRFSGRFYTMFIRFVYVFHPEMMFFSPNIISLGRPPAGDKNIISKKTTVETMLLSIISQVFCWIWDFFESINLTLRYL